MKKNGIGEKPHLKKKTSGFVRVMGRPAGSTRSLHRPVF
jgi:hypothetical protein